jgi:hypothetical protein
MKRDIKALLRQGDPAEVLSSEKAARVRERLTTALAASRTEPARVPTLQPRPWAWLTAAAGLCALAFGLWHGAPRPQPAPARPGPAAIEPAPPRTQIDFATPGGTRIIWTLIPDQPMERRDR